MKYSEPPLKPLLKLWMLIKYNIAIAAATISTWFKTPFLFLMLRCQRYLWVAHMNILVSNKTCLSITHCNVCQLLHLSHLPQKSNLESRHKLSQWECTALIQGRPIHLDNNLGGHSLEYKRKKPYIPCLQDFSNFRGLFLARAQAR